MSNKIQVARNVVHKCKQQQISKSNNINSTEIATMQVTVCRL